MLDRKTKVVLFILCLIWYVPAYLILKPEIGKADYSLPSVVLGAVFLATGLFCHLRIGFDRFFGRIWEKSKISNVITFAAKLTGTLLLLSFGILLIVGCLSRRSENISRKDITLVRGLLAEELDAHLGTRSSSYRKIYLKGFSQFAFEPRYKSYISYHGHINDTVVLGVLKETFEKRIAKAKQMSYLEKHGGSKFVPVYYLSVNGTVYYNPELNNKIDKREVAYTPFFAAFGIMPLIVCVSVWHKEIVGLLLRKQQLKAANALVRLRTKKIM